MTGRSALYKTTHISNQYDCCYR